MKRFWHAAARAPSEDAAGFHILLDGKPVRLPGGARLVLPTAPLADALAAEWQAVGGAVGGDVSYNALPLTRIVGTGQERIAPDPEPVVLELLRYGEGDMLCYRADWPADLAARQHAAWQPWLDWAEAQFGARLAVTAGLVHVPQQPATLAALAAAVARHSPLALAALGVAVPALGSLVLGLALSAGALEAATAFDLSVLDALYQEAEWGSDPESVAKRATLAEDVRQAGRVLAMLRADG